MANRKREVIRELKKIITKIVARLDLEAQSDTTKKSLFKKE